MNISKWRFKFSNKFFDKRVSVKNNNIEVNNQKKDKY